MYNIFYLAEKNWLHSFCFQVREHRYVVPLLCAAIAHMMKHLSGKFRALGNIGDVLIKMGDVEEAVKMYQRQLSFARQGRDRSLEAAAYGALGLGHRLLRCYDKALGYHTQVGALVRIH